TPILHFYLKVVKILINSDSTFSITPIFIFKISFINKRLFVLLHPALSGKYKLNFIKQMQQYETVIILTPLLSEEIVKETLEKFRTYMTENGAEIIHEDNWGLKKLAYPIEKRSTRFYHLTECKAPGDLIRKLELQYKRDERVMRFLSVSLDKHALAYNEKK